MNNLQQFLEQETQNITQYAYFVEHQSEEELAEVVREHNSRIINKVLSEVKKEVEELVRYELGGYPDEGSYMEASERGEFVVIEEISTILENLKVK